MDWKTLSSKVGFEDSWLKYRVDKCQMPDGTIVDPYYVLEYPDWAAALALTEDQQVILVRIYRHGIGKTVLELPGGALNEGGETAESAIERELLEETGYVFDKIVKTAVVSPNPSNHSNLFHAFLALGGKKIQEQELDEEEEIEVVLVSIPEFEQMLKNNELIQAMHVTAGYYGLEVLSRKLS